jgi:hypothetical protein
MAVYPALANIEAILARIDTLKRVVVLPGAAAEAEHSLDAFCCGSPEFGVVSPAV